ncbi:MAG: hypothetical protein GX089_09255 [Fibrobacter sp.]|jgi:hypothetical protein|nr:hypothetical protein [Fibrobacter sp.]
MSLEEMKIQQERKTSGSVHKLDRLHYRRQYVIAVEPVEELYGWDCMKINRYYLYAHPDLEVNCFAHFVLIGNIYNYETPEKNNGDILVDIVKHGGGRRELFSIMKKYAGCYALFIASDKPMIFHDARGLREIFYCTGENRIVCGSQPNLIAEYSRPLITHRTDQVLLDFYKNFARDSQWVGDETPYMGIKHLLPNHSLDINSRKVFRYWPDEPVRKLKVRDSVERSCSFLKGIMKSVVNRQSTAMAVTAGNDSRILLAASRELIKDIYFFVNDINLGPTHPDIYIPERLFKSIGQPFHIHKADAGVDEKFREYYLKNVCLAESSRISYIYNIFHKKLADKILVLGVSEIGRLFFGKDPRKLTALRMASKLGYERSSYALDQCASFKNELISTGHKFNLNVMTLFYWEHRLGNWGATKNSECLIAIEKIDPFNSHYLYETLLGVDEKYRSAERALCPLFKKIIENMWPELLEEPVNPERTVKGKIKRILKSLGVFSLLKEIKYLYLSFRQFLI